jgi:hypothetical protein
MLTNGAGGIDRPRETSRFSVTWYECVMAGSTTQPPAKRGPMKAVRRLLRKSPIGLLVYRHHWLKFRQPLPLLRPQTLNEKINWMKIFGELAPLAACTDKIAVRDYVRERLGDRLRLPILHLVTDRVEDINPEKIPHRQFVVKANHDSGSAVICSDRDSFDFSEARRVIARSISRNYARVFFEPHYETIRPRIMVEEFLANADGSPLGDWRIMCNNGKAVFLYVNLYSDGHKTRAYFDRDWRRIPAKQSADEHVGEIERPAFLDELFEMSESLAADFDFVRVDFNVANGLLYFGEMTFTPQAGYGAYSPPSVDGLFGRGLRLTRSRYALMRWLLRKGLVGGA